METKVVFKLLCLAVLAVSGVAVMGQVTGRTTLTVGSGSQPPSGTDSLLHGATVNGNNQPSVAIPSSWTLAAAQGFDAGPLPAGQSTDTNFDCSFAHTGKCSISAVLASNGASVRWIYNDNQVPGRTFYLSYWDYGQGELFNEEYVLMHPIKHNTGGPAGFEEFGTTLKFWDAGALIYNEPTPEITCCGGQGDFTNVEHDGPRFTNYGQSGWNQWEFWVHANTPGRSDGFQRIYRNGALVWDVEGVIMNGNVDMTGMQVEAGGWYTKSNWSINGQPGATCSTAPGTGSEYGGWQGPFSSLTGNCPPAPPIITRYIDDVILMVQ